MANEKIIEAVVARGRTICDQPKKDGEPVVKTAGQTIKLPESEVARLRELGFLEPEEKAEPAVEQPAVSVTVEDGANAIVTDQ